MPAVAGSVSGIVRFEGQAPEMKPIDMKSDPKCHEKNLANQALNETLVLGEGQTMANVFIEISEGVPEKEYPVPAEPFVLTQEGCMYSPRVFGVRAGQTLRILNPDGTLHNVNVMPVMNTPFNRGMPANVTEMEVKFDKPEGLFPFQCDVHRWMRAYCAVMAHPFFAVTGKDGKYEIKDLPPGEYTIRATHEKLGAQTQKITVKDDAPATADFTFAIKRS